MSELKTSIVLDLVGNLQSKSRQGAQALEGLGRRGSRSLKVLNRGLHGIGRGLDRLGNRYTAMLSGGTAVAAIRQVGNISEKMTDIGVQAGVSAERVNKLKREIFDTARQKDISIDPSELIAAIDEIVTASGDLDFARSSIRELGLGIRGASADGRSIGGLVAEFQKLNKEARPEQVLEAMDILTSQGKLGAFTLQNLAVMGSRVFSVYGSKRKGSISDVSRELGSVLQVIRQTTGSSEQAATSFDALVRVFTDSTKLGKLAKVGITVWDPKALAAGRKELRPINELVKEIYTAAKGDPVKLGSIFDAEAIKVFNAPNLVDNLARFYQVQADGSGITSDSARKAKEFNAQITSLSTAVKQFADRELSGTVGKLADQLNSLDAETVDRWLNVGKNVAIAGAGLWAVSKAVRFGADMTTILGGRKGIAGKLAGAAGGAIPVYIVDGPMSILNPDGTPRGKAGKWESRIKTASPAAGYAAIPLVGGFAVAAASRYAASAIAKNQAEGSTTNHLLELQRRNNVMGGGANSGQGRILKSELDRRFEGDLKITIDAEGRPHINHLEATPGFDIDVDSGPSGQLL